MFLRAFNFGNSLQTKPFGFENNYCTEFLMIYHNFLHKTGGAKPACIIL